MATGFPPVLAGVESRHRLFHLQAVHPPWGRKRWILNTIASFATNGVFYTVIVALFKGRWSYSTLITFSAFGILTLASGLLAAFLRQQRWPLAANLALNVLLVIGSFDLGFMLDEVLLQWLG